MTRPTTARPKAARRRPLRRGGFTLLELILAMSIAATLSLVLYGTLSSAFRARTTAVRQTESMREAAIALDLIEADLGNVTLAGTIDANTGEYGLLGPFLGEASGSGADANGVLTFRCLGRDAHASAAAPGGSRGSMSRPEQDPFAEGIREVTYSLAADRATGKNVLTRSVARNLLSGGTPQAEDESLAGGVRGLAFRYYDGTDWLDAWDSENENNLLPAAVEVTITMDRPDAGPANLTADGKPRTYEMTRVIPLAVADLNALATGGVQ